MTPRGEESPLLAWTEESTSIILEPEYGTDPIPFASPAFHWLRPPGELNKVTTMDTDQIVALFATSEEDLLVLLGTDVVGPAASLYPRDHLIQAAREFLSRRRRSIADWVCGEETIEAALALPEGRDKQVQLVTAVADHLSGLLSGIGHWPVAILLVRAGLEPLRSSFAIRIAIAEAILLDDVAKTRQLLAEHPDYLHEMQGGHPWLQIAAGQNNLEMVKLLLDLGCDVNGEEDYSTRLTVLDSALGNDNPTIVRLLLEHGADPNHGRQVIAAIVGDNEHSLELVKLLEKYGADLHRVFINEMTNQPMNALSSAIDWDKKDVAKYLRSKGAVLPATPAKGEPKTLADEVVAYFSAHFGPVNPLALIEIVPSAWPPISLHVIPGTKERRHITLFTTGMASEPLTVPSGEEDYRLAELFIQVPNNTKYTEAGDPKYGWVMQWLRSCAQYPHVHETWLGRPGTILANGDPPAPLGRETRFTCLLLLAEKDFASGSGAKVQLYRMVPLYTEERELALRDGIAALLQAFDRHGIPFILKPGRANVGLSGA
jgi:ankyrin repeat protein